MTLLRNKGDGTFQDVTRESGLARRPICAHGVVWADYDNDGFVDLLVGSENARSGLFHNNGNGTFTEVSAQAGITGTAYTKAVVAGDYDNDGFPDFYLSNQGSENFLYHNNRDGTFTDVATELGVEKPVFSFPAAFLDYDNDGWLDLHVQGSLPSATEVIRRYLKLPPLMETTRHYRNLGGKAFEDVTKQVGLDHMYMSMGFNFGDVDNDGFLDFFLGTGCPSYACQYPNVLLRNDGGKAYVDITMSSRTGALGKGHGIAFADLFNRGHEDIFAQLGGATRGDQWNSSLFKNPGNKNNWIAVKLVGVKTNRAALGARIKVTVRDTAGASRSIHRVVGSGASFGASPLEKHIGLGRAKAIESIEIWWPTSDTRQVFRNVPLNQFIEIKEFEQEFVRLDRRAIK
jgi:hypothetical protein